MGGSRMIPQELPIETRLIQLAEEASELSQASLKLVRSLDGDTPVPESEARAHLLEEIADVFVCTFALVSESDMMAIETISRQKSKRWEDRLNGKE
jgi:NTP pyrophosphatase (non-canonical NTP hydrolase)